MFTQLRAVDSPQPLRSLFSLLEEETNSLLTHSFITTRRGLWPQVPLEHSLPILTTSRLQLEVRRSVIPA